MSMSDQRNSMVSPMRRPVKRRNINKRSIHSVFAAAMHASISAHVGTVGGLGAFRGISMRLGLGTRPGHRSLSSAHRHIS
ncbi:MAG: hypothetical protein AAF211_03935 [Myxococcota bacterium]